MSADIQDHDCAVCLQKCHHPTQLPCGHIFCFLCVKGVAIQSKKCAMCRAQIPSDYLDHPVLLEKLPTYQSSPESSTEIYQWYYEGRNGWWKYDERSSLELETAFSAGEAGCSLLLAGALYNIDFQNMLQIRRSDPTRRRKVRRDTSALPAKGVAGIKNDNNLPLDETKSSTEQNTNQVINNQQISENEIIVIDDDDDDNDDTDENGDSLEIVDTFSSVTLTEPESLQEHSMENAS